MEGLLVAVSALLGLLALWAEGRRETAEGRAHAAALLAGRWSPDLTPRQFERHCADALALRGWEVALGRGVADQGVDVLARRDGVSVVIQCKHQRRPVGNRAVQEALAGRGYAGADAAAVVSSSPYTPAARALAARVGVALLRVEDLGRAGALPGAGAEPPGPPPRSAPTAAPARRRPGGLGGALALSLAAALLLAPRPPPPLPPPPPAPPAAAR